MKIGCDCSNCANGYVSIALTKSEWGYVILGGVIGFVVLCLIISGVYASGAFLNN